MTLGVNFNLGTVIQGISADDGGGAILHRKEPPNDRAAIACRDAREDRLRSGSVRSIGDQIEPSEDEKKQRDADTARRRLPIAHLSMQSKVTVSLNKMSVLVIFATRP